MPFTAQEMIYIQLMVQPELSEIFLNLMENSATVPFMITVNHQLSLAVTTKMSISLHLKDIKIGRSQDRLTLKFRLQPLQEEQDIQTMVVNHLFKTQSTVVTMFTKLATEFRL